MYTIEIIYKETNGHYYAEIFCSESDEGDKRIIPIDYDAELVERFVSPYKENIEDLNEYCNDKIDAIRITVNGIREYEKIIKTYRIKI